MIVTSIPLVSGEVAVAAENLAIAVELAAKMLTNCRWAAVALVDMAVGPLVFDGCILD